MQRRPELFSPPASHLAELAIGPFRTDKPCVMIFLAPFTSRSWMLPHSGHTHWRMVSGSVSWTLPHAEQLLLDGNQRPATSTKPPPLSALYSSCRRNSKKPMSDRKQARLPVLLHAAHFQLFDKHAVKSSPEP